jgi:hypothetical protein
MKRFTHYGPALTIIGLAVLGFSAAASMAQPPDGAPMMGRGGPAAMMMLADTNKDGLLSAAEIQAHQDARFTQMDANKDGELSSDEMGPPAMGGPGQGPGKASPMGNTMTESRDAMRAERHAQMLAVMDSDKNGTVNRAEFNAYEGHRMDQADSNHDGQLDQAEIEAMTKTMGGPGGRK